jgi:hypothetical protein
MNMNISIDLDMLPGARVMDIQGKTCTKQCIVIPIDNKIGTVCDGYLTKDPQTGLSTEKFFSHVKLNLVAVEHRTKKHGISHGLKPSFSQEKTERMTEDEVYNTPWMGTVKPWGRIKDDIGDLPEGNNNNEW